MKKVAIVGCGRMGAFTSQSVLETAPQCWFPLSHADAAAAHPDLKIVAMVDTDVENLRKASEKFSILSKYSSIDRMLACHTLDLVCLATRTIGRAELISRVYHHGIKAIHVEKPLCNTTQEYHMLSKIIMDNGFYITWGAIRRYMPAYRQAVALSKSGQYGKLLEIRVNFGSSSLFWTHAHAFDLIAFGAGDRAIKSVQAKFKDTEFQDMSKLTINNDPTLQYCIVEFEDDVSGIISQSIGADFILSCEKAEISVLNDGAELVIRHYKDGPYPITDALQIEKSNEMSCGTLAPLVNLTGCLNGNKESIEINRRIKHDILRAQWMMFAAAISESQSNRKIHANEQLPDLRIMAKTNDIFA